METKKQIQPEEKKAEEQKKPNKVEPGIFTIHRLPQSKEEQDLWRRLIVVFESAYF